MLAAISTVVSMAAFIAICWWAWSSGRQRANRDSALLPFALPDEDPASAAGTVASHPSRRNIES
jgi:cytochrome c oxidase cbb3-type subunit 4